MTLGSKCTDTWNHYRSAIRQSPAAAAAGNVMLGLLDDVPHGMHADLGCIPALPSLCMVSLTDTQYAPVVVHLQMSQVAQFGLEPYGLYLLNRRKLNRIQSRD